MSDGLDIIDKNYRINFQNKVLKDRFGDLTGKICFEEYMKRKAPCEICLVQKALKTGKTQKIELSAPDGKIYELTSTPFKDTDGKSKVIEIVHDITSLKETDIKIKESEERFRELFDHMSSGVAVYEAIDNGNDFIIKDFNRAAEKIENVKRKIIVGRSVLDVFPGVKEFGIFDVFKRVWKTGKPEHYPIKLYKDNRISGWRENYVYKLPSGEIVSIYDDITKRKQVEEKIEESEKRFRKSIMDAPLPIMIHKENGKVISINEAWSEMTGYTKEEIPTISTWTKKAFGKKRDLIKDVIDKLYEIDKRVDEGEFKIKTKSGDMRIWHFSSAPLGKSVDGGRLVISMALDVTEQKKREEEYKNLIDGMNDTVFVIDFKGKFIDVNDTAVEFLGYSREELLTMGPTDIDPVLSEKDIAGLIEGMKKGEKQVFETAHKTKTGEIIPVEVSSSLISYYGKPSILSIARDITERKEREIEYKNLMDGMNDTAFVINFKGKFIEVNDTAVEFLGYSREELLSMGPNDIDANLSPEDIERLIDRMKMGETGVFETAHKTKSGDIIPVEVSSSLITYHGKLSILSIARNISERKKAEEQLRKSEEQLSAIFNNTSDLQLLFSLEKDGELRAVNVNETAISTARKLGLDVSKESFLGETVRNILKYYITPAEKDTEEVYKMFRRTAETGEPISYEETYTFGNRFYSGEVTVLPVLDESGKCSHVLWNSHDITDRKEAEELLKKSEERFQTILENLPHGAFVHDLYGKIILVNKASSELTGYTKDELLKMKVSDIGRDRKDIWLKLQKEGGFFRGETTFRRKDGTKLPVEIHAGVVALGENPTIIGIAHDITERKKALEDLRKNEDQLSVIFNNASDMLTLWSVDEDGEFRLTRVNQTSIDAAAAFGINFLREANIGKTLVETSFPFTGISKGFYNNAAKYFQQTAKTGEPAFFEEEISFLNRTFYAENTTVPVLDERGKCVYILWTIHDVTKTKRTLEALQKSEERFETVIENLPDEIFVHGLDGKFILVNKASCKKTGYTKDELLNMKVGDIDHESISRDDRKNIWKKLQKKGGFERIETTHYRKDGSSYPAEIYFGTVTFKGSPMIIGIAHDITERKKAIEKLKESEERFQTIIENLPHAVSLHDLDGNFVLVNEALCKHTGYSRDEYMEMKVEDVDRLSQTREDRKKIWLKLNKGGHTHFESELSRKDGSSYPVEIHINAISLEGKPMILAIAQDISDRKKALENLQKSEEKYRNLYDSMIEAFARTDMEGNIIEFNKQYLDMLGYTGDEIKKLKYTDLTPEKWLEMETKIIKEQIIKRGYSDVYEKEYIRKDGTVFPVELRVFLLKDDDGSPNGMWAIVRDITERKKMEEEIRKIERLESLGILAGGIAHDFNNLLTGILGNLSLAQMAEDEDFNNILEEAKQASIQAKNLTQQLLTFSKGGEPIKGKVSIEDIIRESAEFSLHGSNVRCEFNFPDNLWKVEVDKGQMSQVIDNLVINSNQAMPDGGKIHIKAANIILEEENLLYLPEGKYVKITLQDEGIGVPDEYLSRIFDPYFSTKQEGSGLGLATVYSIIQRHEGYITVQSKVGDGTTFFIYLPAIEEKISKRGEKKAIRRALKGEGRILIMDDEKIVRRAVGGMLGRLGYTVESAENGEEALVKYKEAMNSEKLFDAVILDLTVPGGMGGKKTIEKLLKIDPNVKAIVSSGYSTDPVMANYEKYGFKAVVAKPFDLKELNEAIKKVLE